MRLPECGNYQFALTGKYKKEKTQDQNVIHCSLITSHYNHLIFTFSFRDTNDKRCEEETGAPRGAFDIKWQKNYFSRYF